MFKRIIIMDKVQAPELERRIGILARAEFCLFLLQLTKPNLT